MPEHNIKTFFTEHEQDDVKGFTIIAHDETEGYHIAEKWLKEEGDDVWVQYWIPEAQLNRRVSDGACEPNAELSDKQYKQVCEMVGMPTQDERQTASA